MMEERERSFWAWGHVDRFPDDAMRRALDRPWYDRERPETFALALKAVKHAVDPAWIMNPGVLIDSDGDGHG
jgi:FAD/FMN-containing dehydrogenase